MKKKYLAFFEEAKNRGLSASELSSTKSRSLNIEIFRSEVTGFSIDDSEVVNARGIYQKRFGAASTEKTDKQSLVGLVDKITSSATINENVDPAIIFPGSPKYQKRHIFDKNLAKVSVDEKIALLFEIEKRLKTSDPRVTEVSSVTYQESFSEYALMNSYGLNLHSRNNYFYIYAAVVVKQDEEIKTGYRIFLHNDFAEFPIDKFVDEVLSNALEKLGGKPLPTGRYKTVINPRVTASLLNFYMQSAIAENVQKNTSLFMGKLNTPIASKKVTIEEKPLLKNIFYSYFDAEGVATYNKAFVEKGVLKLYAYNLTTAAKEGVETTANAQGSGSKIGTGYTNLVLKPGRLDEQALFEKVKDGFYLTEVQGLHAGLNPTSGNFSLQASGFAIRNGKLAEPIAHITVAGNLLDVFKDVVAVGNNLELQLSSTSTPSILIKGLMVAS
ncbi:MAG: TldD/PmbA family protein [Bacilli bacterium]|jgi:PmbA protein